MFFLPRVRHTPAYMQASGTRHHEGNYILVSEDTAVLRRWGVETHVWFRAVS